MLRCARGAFTNRGNLPPSDTASKGKSSYRGWATALPSPTQSVLPLSMNAPECSGAFTNRGDRLARHAEQTLAQQKPNGITKATPRVMLSAAKHLKSRPTKAPLTPCLSDLPANYSCRLG